MLFPGIRKKKSKGERKKNILSAVAPESAYAESFRTLRTNLHFSGIDTSVKSVLVTSALQSEGKTNTATNLGYTVARTGKKVLLIDADLRKPLLSSIFNLGGKPGLTDLIVNTFDSPVLTGRLSEYSINDLLLLVRFQNLTGQLHIKSHDDGITLLFKHGEILDAVWNNRPSSGHFMAMLVEKQRLKPADADTVHRIQKQTGRQLGHILVTMGFLTKDEVEKRLANQAAEAVRLAAAITDGEFEFAPSGPDAFETRIFPGQEFTFICNEVVGNAENLRYVNHMLEEAVHQIDEDSLWVLGAGQIPPNPSEIISSEKTATILNLLKQKFDFVIVDSPPVLPASDAMLMAPRTDGTLLVVRAGYSNKKLVKRVTQQFKNANLPLLGVVLNRVAEKNQDYYYRYYRQYKS